MRTRTFRFSEQSPDPAAPPSPRLRALLALARALAELRLNVMRAGALERHKIGT